VKASSVVAETASTGGETPAAIINIIKRWRNGIGIISAWWQRGMHQRNNNI